MNVRVNRSMRACAAQDHCTSAQMSGAAQLWSGSIIAAAIAFCVRRRLETQ